MSIQPLSTVNVPSHSSVALNLLIVPVWMTETIQRENCSMDVLSDPAKLRDIFSIADLGLYCHVNGNRSLWVGEDVADSFDFPPVIGQLLEDPAINAATRSHVINNQSNNLPDINSSDLMGPLHEEVERCHISFRVTSLGGQTILLTPFTDQTLNIDKVSVLDDLLYVANMYMSMEGLAKLPLFKRFLNSI